MKAVPALERTAKSLERTGETVVTTVVSVRRRMDIAMLRWQARMDSPVWDRSLPWLTAALLATFLSLLALARSQDLGIGYQLGHYLQAVDLMDRGFEPVVNDLGHNLFADQGAWVFWPIAWAIRVLPVAGTLLVLQSVALALGVVPIWRIARGPANLRIGAAGALMVAYAVHPSIHNLNLAGFHPEALALPALMAAYLAAQRGRWRLVAVLVLLVVATRSDLGLAVAALGLLLVGEDERTAGWTMATFGLTWFLVMSFVVQPMVGDGGYPHLDAFARYGTGVVGIVLGMLSDPLGLIGDLSACTDLTTKPWVVEAGVTVIDAPFAAHGNIATAGGCLAAPYLAAWMIARGGSSDLACEALHYVAPVGEKRRFVDHALSVIDAAT